MAGEDAEQKMWEQTAQIAEDDRRQWRSLATMRTPGGGLHRWAAVTARSSRRMPDLEGGDLEVPVAESAWGDLDHPGT